CLDHRSTWAVRLGRARLRSTASRLLQPNKRFSLGNAIGSASSTASWSRSDRKPKASTNLAGSSAAWETRREKAKVAAGIERRANKSDVCADRAPWFVRHARFSMFEQRSVSRGFLHAQLWLCLRRMRQRPAAL